jgi:hypothetical protein
MQFAKDSFYVALRDRLGRLNPERTVYIDGITRPAVVVTENEVATCAPAFECAFLIHWGAAQACTGFGGIPNGPMALECSISYATSGSREDGLDRGRMMGILDSELLQICAPAFTLKKDYTKPEPLALGSNILWTAPKIEKYNSKREGRELGARDKTRISVSHIARVTLFFYPEVA